MTNIGSEMAALISYELDLKWVIKQIGKDGGGSARLSLVRTAIDKVHIE